MRLFGRSKDATATSQLVTIDFRGGRVFVNAMTRRASGVWRVGPIVAAFEKLPEAGELGEAVEAALASSRESESGDSDPDPFRSVLEAAQVRAWAQYIKGLRSVEVARDRDGFTVTRLQNLGARNGLVPEAESVVRMLDPSRDDVGHAVISALGPENGSSGATSAAADERADDDPVVEFGRNVAWLALRTQSQEGTARALALADMHDTSWREAFEQLDSAGDAPLAFVTPPLQGWTLVVLSPALVEQGVLDLASLSVRFGEAQKFVSRRVVDYYEWQRWIDGAPVRRYAWVGDRGEIPFDEGEPARPERGIHRKADLDGDWGYARFADENLVLEIAAEWSVDPSRLGEDETSWAGFLGTSAFAERRVGDRAKMHPPAGKRDQ